MTSSPKRKKASRQPSNEQGFDALLRQTLERERNAFNSRGAGSWTSLNFVWSL
jgi:hypothetical protein